MAEESPKTLESAKTVSMANGQLTRAVPGSRRTSPEEPARAVYALRKAPTRSGPSDAKPRGGKRVKALETRLFDLPQPSAPQLVVKSVLVYFV